MWQQERQLKKRLTLLLHGESEQDLGSEMTTNSKPKDQCFAAFWKKKVAYRADLKFAPCQNKDNYQMTSAG